MNKNKNSRLPVTDRAFNPLVEKTLVSRNEGFCSKINNEPSCELAEFSIAHDGFLLNTALIQWQFGDWSGLANIDGQVIENHPDKAKLLLLVAVATLQLGEAEESSLLIESAIQSGFNKTLALRFLISGVHNSLGCAYAIGGMAQAAIDNFQAAVGFGITEGMGGTRVCAEIRMGEQLRLIGPSVSKLPLQLLKAAREKSRRAYPTALGSKMDNKLTSPFVVSGIVVAGMRHSGSTVLFNIIRLAFKKSGIDFCSFYSEGKNASYDKTNNNLFLIKTHEFRDDVLSYGSLVLTTRRDLRDTVASASRRKFPMLDKVGGAVEYAKYNRVLHDVWLPYSDFVFVYEDFIATPVAVVADVLACIGLDSLHAEEIYQEIAKLPVDQYETTLLSPMHITDPERKFNYQNSLEQNVVTKINNNHEIWLKSFSYMIE